MLSAYWRLVQKIYGELNQRNEDSRITGDKR